MGPSCAKLEYNWRFLVEYYGTFAPLGRTPHEGVFKASLGMLNNLVKIFV